MLDEIAELRSTSPGSHLFSLLPPACRCVPEGVKDDSMLMKTDPGIPPHRLRSWQRREWLRAGGLGALGISLPQLLSASRDVAGSGGSFGRAKSCILLFLSGGPRNSPVREFPDNTKKVTATFCGGSHLYVW